MKTIKHIGRVTMAALFGIAVLAGCNDQVSQSDIDEQQEEVDQAQDKLDALKERQQIEDKLQSDLAGIQKKIDQLEARVDEVSDDREVEMRGKIAQLNTQHEQLEEHLRELRAASGDKWAQLRVNAEAAWHDLSDHVDEKMKEWRDDANSDEAQQASGEGNSEQSSEDEQDSDRVASNTAEGNGNNDDR